MPLQCIWVYNRISRTQLGNYLFFGFQSEWNDCSQDCLRPVCAINFSRNQSSDKLINFLDSQLDTRDSRFDPRDSRLNAQNYRGSSIESRGSRDCQLTFERYCNSCIFCCCHVTLMLLVLRLVLNRLRYFHRLMLFNEAKNLLELFKVNSLLVIYIASFISA